MKYYFIKNSIDRKVIGRQYPQSQDDVWPSFITDCFEDPRSFKKFHYRKAPPNVVVPDFVMRKSAKVTDFIIAASSKFPIVSKKMVDIIDKQKSTNIQWLPTHLLWKGTKIDNYFVFNPLEFNYEILDLEKTKFNIQLDMLKFYPPVYKEFYPKSLDEILYYHEAIYNNSTPDRLVVFNPKIKDNLSGNVYFLISFYIQADLFYCCLIISEKVKQELEAAKCTGFDLIEL
jgi:hypothetical protein